QRGLAGDIRPMNKPEAAGICILRRSQMSIIGDEGCAVTQQGLFHYWMAAALNDKGMTVVDLRPCIFAFFSKLSESARDVEASKRLAAILDVGALFDDARRKALENF